MFLMGELLGNLTHLSGGKTSKLVVLKPSGNVGQRRWLQILKNELN